MAVRFKTAGPLLYHFSGQTIIQYQFASAFSYKTHPLRFEIATTFAKQSVHNGIIQADLRWHANVDWSEKDDCV